MIAVAMAGIDEVVISWSLNQSLSAVDSQYKNVKVKLCFAPVSQVDRGWRKTNDDLKKDKTCQFDIIEQPYNSNSKNNTVSWTAERDVPKGKYFVRAYVGTLQGLRWHTGRAPTRTTQPIYSRSKPSLEGMFYSTLQLLSFLLSQLFFSLDSSLWRK